jgi:hypothetical protein
MAATLSEELADLENPLYHALSTDIQTKVINDLHLEPPTMAIAFNRRKPSRQSPAWKNEHKTPGTIINQELQDPRDPEHL